VLCLDCPASASPLQLATARQSLSLVGRQRRSLWLGGFADAHASRFSEWGLSPEPPRTPWVGEVQLPAYQALSPAKAETLRQFEARLGWALIRQSLRRN
jgi:hypothetical protein